MKYSIIALAAALPAIAALSVGGVSAGTNNANEDVMAPTCFIDAATKGGALALEAQFVADAAVEGHYAFRVKSVGGANSTNINQGGAFVANEGETVTLGKMTLGGNATYEVSLKVEAAGETFECNERLGANI